MLGILGLGSYSTLHTVKQLNARANRERGGYSTFPFLMLNIDFDTVNPWLPEEYSVLSLVVSEALEKLDALGIHEILVPNITLHQVIDEVYRGTELHKKLLHPLHLLRDKLQDSPMESAVVLGSYYTMTSSYLREFISIPQLVLKKDTLLCIDQMRKEVYAHGVQAEHVDQFRKIIVRDFPLGTVCIIACTEISLVASAARLPSSAVIDLMEMQIERATLDPKV